MKKLLLTSAFVALVSAPVFGATYNLDVANSKVEFEVSHLKLTKVDGKFSEFSGTIDYEKKKLVAFEGEVSIASVDTNDKKRDAHLNKPDMFDSKKFPNMSFKMTKFEKGKIHGDLTIKTTTKPITFEAKINENGSALDIDATTTIKRSEFGISWDNVFKDNAVGDDVIIKLSLKASK